MVNLFERLSAGRPSPPTERTQSPSQAQRLLNWLLRWDQPTVRVRDIRIYGPYALRNQKNVVASAEILVKSGWLTPVQTRQHNGHKWRIVRRPIADPIIAAER